jgi:hypothetical protein
VNRRIAGLERLAQTEERQDAADYNRCLGKWKDYLPIGSFMHETISDLILPIAHTFTLGVRPGGSQRLAESIYSYLTAALIAPLAIRLRLILTVFFYLNQGITDLSELNYTFIRATDHAASNVWNARLYEYSSRKPKFLWGHEPLISVPVSFKCYEV